MEHGTNLEASPSWDNIFCTYVQGILGKRLNSLRRLSALWLGNGRPGSGVVSPSAAPEGHARLWRA